MIFGFGSWLCCHLPTYLPTYLSACLLAYPHLLLSPVPPVELFSLVMYIQCHLDSLGGQVYLFLFCIRNLWFSVFV